MAQFVSQEIMGTTLEFTDRYSDLKPRGIGASGIVWYIPLYKTLSAIDF